MSEQYRTIVEVGDFGAFAKKHLTESEYSDLVFFLSHHPEEGDLIVGTGGVRKLRWAAKGKGKSGGVRVIYYYYNDEVPLFLITGYAKGDKANISDSEKKAMRGVLPKLVETYRGK